MDHNCFKSLVSLPSSDFISKIKFNSNLLCVASWDGILYYLDYKSDKLFANIDIGFPQFSIDVIDEATIVSAGLDQHINIIDLTNLSIKPINVNLEAFSSVCYSSSTYLIHSGSWDKHIISWDSRSYQQAFFSKCEEKIYDITTNDNYLIAACSNRKIQLYDLRNISSPIQTRESSLKSQTKSISCFNNVFACGSIEGRISIDWINTGNEFQSQKYAFKSHRISNNDGTETVFPVNAIDFHPKYGTFATAGGDGLINIWDKDAKKRLKVFDRLPSSVSSISFSSDGKFIAAACSEYYEKKENNNTISKLPNRIFLKSIKEEDVRPRLSISVF